ncbi:MAG TPA: class I SAM-dependent methyltransferase [Allosphingosinicella sp.]
MRPRDALFNVRKGIRKLRGKPTLPWFDFNGQALDPSERHRLLKESRTPLAQLFYQHEGRTAHKWIHYLDIYETHFARYRGTDVHMLEIGVQMGGSLELWRKYFGEKAVIYGVDIDPKCADRVSEPNQVRIGSQGDRAFLKSVAAEMGSLDIILDDGSHIASHQRITFDTLFPLLKEGGLFVIEDIHSSYWPGLQEGGYRRRGTAVELVKRMIDDMHAWYHGHRTSTPAKTQISGIHIYDSMVFIEKGKRSAPQHIKITGTN